MNPSNEPPEGPTFKKRGLAFRSVPAKLSVAERGHAEDYCWTVRSRVTMFKAQR